MRRAVPAAALVGVALGASACGKAVTETTTSAPGGAGVERRAVERGRGLERRRDGRRRRDVGGRLGHRRRERGHGDRRLSGRRGHDPHAEADGHARQGRLGRLPRDADARPDLRLRLPGEHGRSRRCATPSCASSPTARSRRACTTSADDRDTTMVFTLRDGVTFWDGSPLTADDVVFSLQREMDPKLGGFYAAVFARVDIDHGDRPERGHDQARSSPTTSCEGELSVDAGHHRPEEVRRGQGRGRSARVDGGTMCTGPVQARLVEDAARA